MSKFLSILNDLAKGLNVSDKIKPLLEGKDEKDLDVEAIRKVIVEGQNEQLTILGRNHQVELNKKKDEAYKSAERKIKGDIQQQLKDKFSLESDSDQLDDLIDEVQTKLTKTAGKGDKLTDDDVKKHPVYVNAEKQWQKQAKEAKDSGEKALNDFKAQVEGEKVFGDVSKEALSIFDKMNPVLSSDAGKAAKQREMVTRMLSDYKYERIDGVTVITDKNGNVVEDNLKNKVTLEAHVKSLVEPYFDFNVADPRKAPNGGNGGNGGSGGPGAGAMKYTGTLPKTKEEAAAMVVDGNISLEHRQEIQAYADTLTA